MKADVVYPLGRGSKDGEDWELRYSLRSLAEQEWAQDIYLVGYKPGWVKNVKHIPCIDPHKPKDANIIYKILKACQQESLSEFFVINSDDHYIMKPISLMELGPWLEYPSSLKDAYLKHAISRWYMRMLRTMDFCQKQSWPQWVFESHIPYLVRKEDYIEVMSQLPYEKDSGLLSHVYYNAILKMSPEKTRPGQVFRAKTKTTLEKLEEGFINCTFLNHSDAGLCENLKQLMENRFTIPSPWEKS